MSKKRVTPSALATWKWGLTTTSRVWYSGHSKISKTILRPFLLKLFGCWPFAKVEGKKHSTKTKYDRLSETFFKTRGRDLIALFIITKYYQRLSKAVLPLSYIILR
jgi:hypothetical protein